MGVKFADRPYATDVMLRLYQRRAFNFHLVGIGSKKDRKPMPRLPDGELQEDIRIYDVIGHGLNDDAKFLSLILLAFENVQCEELASSA